MAEEVPHEDHGHSVAAWTTVVLLLLAAASVSIGVAWGLHFFYYLGGALLIVGLLAGKILASMGFGNKHVHLPPPLPADQQEQGARQQVRSASAKTQ
ncbi:HGxxPAAW family protein [Flexivirga meconopsidis]|uniref:HGxxPAAW family protein n=1 Tax=Flexivirga meconopsidis TaxID=2977121 RepID=UPI00223FF173|nr:HGxxPAAW family protein [Flexivirga meconopsidis]